MSRRCALIARQLHFSRRECLGLQIAAAMKDIGKIGVPDGLVRIPAALKPLYACRGTHFDSHVLDAFKAVLPEILDMRRQ